MAGLFMVFGAFFVMVAALGVLRMPELYARMHSSTKAGTLGLGLILFSVALHFGDIGIVARALATVVFIALTAPVGAHVVGRAAYYSGVKPWKGTLVDEIKQSEHQSRLSVERMPLDRT